MYQFLIGTRMAEQALIDMARRRILAGHHSGLGHESIGVGVGMAVRLTDCVQLSHRSGMMLDHARGGRTLREAILAKLGLGVRLTSDAPRTLPSVGLVGSGVPMAVGVAMADVLRGRDCATVTFFGDGASNEGAVHEAMNLAGARRLPVLFMLENNGIAVSTRTSESTAADNLFDRARGYGMPGYPVDGQDPVAAFKMTRRALGRARAGQGPTLLEFRMARWEPHAEGLPDVRSEIEIAAARSADGISALRAQLLLSGAITEEALDEIESACRAEIDAAVAEVPREAARADVPAPLALDDARRRTFANG
jgi:TPP-dependent pyruvate/acetoin dehydrogenase alpha subunit